jgi:hypothetical protein
MIDAPNPHPTDALDGLVEFRADPDAAPGNVVSALAALLIGMARRRNADGQEAPDIDNLQQDGEADA